MLAFDPIGPECVEGPVLEKDVDRLAECRGAGGQHGCRLQPVIGPGEEDQVQWLIHQKVTSEVRRGSSPRWASSQLQPWSARCRWRPLPRVA